MICLKASYGRWLWCNKDGLNMIDGDIYAIDLIWVNGLRATPKQPKATG